MQKILFDWEDNFFRPSTLPAWLTDETLYGLCCRYHLLSGNRLASITSSQLFGSATAGLRHDFPSHLNHFVSVSRGVWGSVADIVQHGTVLPFYRPFITPKISDLVVDKMQGESVAYAKYLLGLPASRIGAAHPLKSCPVCRERDQQVEGVAYWHRSHQLPSVWACAQHGVLLEQAEVKTNLVGRLQWLLPENVPYRKNDLPEHLINNVIRLALKITAITEAMMAHATVLNGELLRYAYLYALKQRELLTATGNVMQQSFIRAFNHHYAVLWKWHPFETLNPDFNSDHNYVSSLVRKRKKMAHPLRQLLLISFLFEDWQSFMAIYHSGSITPPTKPDVRVRRIKIQKDDPRKAAFLNMVNEQKTSIRKAAEATGITIDMGMAWASQAGITIKRRSHTINDDVRASMRQMLKSGLGKEVVASQCNISSQSVDRMLWEEPETHREWQDQRYAIKLQLSRKMLLDFAATHPGFTRADAKHNKESAYSWLLRNDGQWLSQQLPTSIVFQRELF
jgi:hypothetical protein